jgi:hypothetical protein
MVDVNIAEGFARMAPMRRGDDALFTASAGYVHEGDFSFPSFVKSMNGFGRRLREDTTVFLVEIFARLRGQSHVPFLASAHDQKVAAIFEDELGFGLRYDVRSSVLFFRKPFSPLFDFARKAYHHVVFVRLSVDRDRAEFSGVDRHLPLLELFS